MRLVHGNKLDWGNGICVHISFLLINQQVLSFWMDFSKKLFWFENWFASVFPHRSLQALFSVLYCILHSLVNCSFMLFLFSHVRLKGKFVAIFIILIYVYVLTCIRCHVIDLWSFNQYTLVVHHYIFTVLMFSHSISLPFVLITISS